MSVIRGGGRLAGSAGWGLALCAVLAAGASAESLGRNGGVRLLLHVEPFTMPSGGIVADPCSLLVPLTDVGDFVVDHPGTEDSVLVWAYLYAPRDMIVRGAGFAIEYENVDFVVSGVCAPVIGQDPKIMGTWPESGSEIACVWRTDAAIEGELAPIAWFVLRGLGGDGYFRVAAGKSPFSGLVGDDGVPTRENRIWAYGTIGFGQRSGELPIPDPASIAAVSGALEITLR